MAGERRRWASDDLEELCHLHRAGVPLAQIAARTGRTIGAVKVRVSLLIARGDLVTRLPPAAATRMEARDRRRVREANRREASYAEHAVRQHKSDQARRWRQSMTAEERAAAARATSARRAARNAMSRKYATAALGTNWTTAEDAALVALHGQGSGIAFIAIALGRTISAITTRLSRLREKGLMNVEQ